MTPSDVKIVADNIDDFIEVSDGINRLRKAVLTLAVSGKLVPQDKNEGTAEDLYTDVLSKRRKSAGRKPDKLLQEIPESSYPYEVPRNWKWVPLGNVTELVYGDGLPKEQRNDSGKYFAYGANGPLGKTDVINCKEGGIIVGRKGSAGAVTLVQEPFFATDVTYFIPEGQFGAFDSKYLFQLLTAIDLPKHAKGIKPGISRKEVYALPIALPPFAEQKRIVEKVQSVMKQLDELEAKKRERDEVRTRLARSAMQALGKGDTKVAFDHLTELIKAPADIKELENALLTLAVSGKLVHQDKKDGSVDLDTSVPNFGDAFDIPITWKWAQLEDVCGFKYGYTDSAKDAGGARFVRITDMMDDGSINENEEKYVDLTPESEKYLLNSGDILTARIGATYGRTVLFKGDYKAIFASYLIRTDFDHNLVHPEYYLAFARSGLYWSQARSLVSGSAQPQFNANLIKKMFIPIPPVAEQKRIVKKVEEVMALTDRLRQVVGEK